MGLFNFVKDAGEKLWDAVTGQHDKDDQAKKVQEHLNKTGIPDADKVNIQIADGKATVTGDGISLLCAFLNSFFASQLSWRFLNPLFFTYVIMPQFSCKI